MHKRQQQYETIALTSGVAACATLTPCSKCAYSKLLHVVFAVSVASFQVFVGAGPPAGLKF